MTSADTDRFLRIRLLIGDERVERLKNSRVTVVGLGAVGSYATEALARAGVGHLRLVDFDNVSATNINRQLYALGSTIGQPKAAVAAARIRDINSACVVEPMQIFAAAETFNALFDNKPDLVIDAIDSLNPKVQLISYLHKNRIPFISAMGAASRVDASCIRYGDLFGATHCPLARLVRKRLRRNGILTGVACVYSDEPLQKTVMAPLDAAEQAIERGRKRRPIGSLSTMTGMFGLRVAHHALEHLCGGLV
jgi:tRNA A37 threonylcarbamoyladenosine dehydratase